MQTLIQDNSTLTSPVAEVPLNLHRHVASNWLRRCKPADQVLRDLRDQEYRHEDIWMSGSDIRLDEQFMVDDMELTGLALNGLLRFTSVPLAMVRYLRDKGFHGQAVDHLNREFESLGSRQFFVRTTQDDQGKRFIRAFCSSRYAPMSNADTLQMAMEAFPRGAAEDLLVCHLEDDGDTFRAMMLAPDFVQTFPDSDYGVGVSLQTSEVGILPILLESLSYRSVCANGMLLGSQSHGRLSRKHQGNIDLDELRLAFKRTVVEALDHGRDATKAMQLLKTVSLPDTDRSIVLLSREHGLDKEESKSWHKGVVQTLQEPGADWEGTAFALIQGLTRSARDNAGIQRANLERTANLIMGPKVLTGATDLRDHWRRINERAESVDERQLAAFLN